MDNFKKGQIDDAQLQLLRSGENSDLKIRCRDRTWAVQKGILAQRCPFFRGAMRSGFQEQSSGVIVMDEDEPQAIDELLKYLYTLSDHINVLSIDESMFPCIDPSSQVFCLSYTDQELSEHPQPNPTLVKEVTYLVDVLVAADKYGVCDLAAIAGQKIDDRLEMFRYWAGRLEPRHGPRVTSALSDAVQFEDEMPLLEQYQHHFLATVTSELDIHVIFADVEFILAHPKLTREVLWHRNNALTSEREKTSEMLEDMPKTRRHRYQ